MRVDLRALKPNPMRDFTIDPIDPDAVERLRQSIEEDGFWGGVVCRKLPDGRLQIGAGHHRVEAAKQAGITFADLFVADEMDDATMIRVYARENATQRGHTSTALAGTVASALRYLTKDALGEASPDFWGGPQGLATVRGHIMAGRGVGEDIILKFLANVHGINKYSVVHQLTNLKSSGNYARLVAEVEQDIAQEADAAEHALAEAARERRRLEEEHAEAERKRNTAKAERLAAERAEIERKHAAALARKSDAAKARTAAGRAATEARKRVKTFDFEGVAKHFKNPHQVDVFRNLVTSGAIRPYLAVEDQATLAAQVVSYIGTLEDKELSGPTIRKGFLHIWLNEKSAFEAYARAQAKKLGRLDLPFLLRKAMENFRRHLDGLTQEGAAILTITQEWDEKEPFPSVSVDFRAALHDATMIVTKLSSDRRFMYE